MCIMEGLRYAVANLAPKGLACKNSVHHGLPPIYKEPETKKMRPDL